MRTRCRSDFSENVNSQKKERKNIFALFFDNKVKSSCKTEKFMLNYYIVQEQSGKPCVP